VSEYLLHIDNLQQRAKQVGYNLPITVDQVRRDIVNRLRYPEKTDQFSWYVTRKGFGLGGMLTNFNRDLLYNPLYEDVMKEYLEYVAKMSESVSEYLRRHSRHTRKRNPKHR